MFLINMATLRNFDVITGLFILNRTFYSGNQFLARNRIEIEQERTGFMGVLLGHSDRMSIPAVGPLLHGI
jgi:hypothetical protein